MITVTRDGGDMVLLIGENGDSIRIVNQYEGYNYLPIENFEFSDGTVVEWKEFLDRSLTLDKVDEDGVLKDYKTGLGTRDTTLIGSDEDNTIYGYDGDDIIIGGKGNDVLYGGTDNDTYIFNLGDGQDIIDEEGNRNDDKIVFGEGITLDMITVTRDGGDMVLLIGDNGDSIRIVKQYEGYNYKPIETFELADGTKGKIDTFKSELVVDDASSADVDVQYGSYACSIEQSEIELESVFNDVFGDSNADVLKTGESISDDFSDIQTLLLIENMSAFSGSSNVYDTLNFSNTSSDTSAFDQLLTSSSI